MDLLELCGFEAQDIESELPRVEKAFNKLGITAEDIERGKQRLTKYYDMKLKGVRKIFRLLVKEVVNLVLAREEGKKKIVYGFMSPGFDIIGSALVSKSKEVYALYLCSHLQIVVGCIFDKMVPILEEAEKRWVKSGAVAHCGNVKTLVGVIALDLIPRPDLIITSGFLCDTAPKTIDLLHGLYGIPTCCHDVCQDREFREYADATKRMVEFSAKSIRRLIHRVQEVVGFEITDHLLREVLDAKSGLDDAILKLRRLIESSDPLPISATHPILWRILGSSSRSIESLPEVIDAINTLYEELQERVNEGTGVVEKGAPRILAICPHHYADPRLEHLVGEVGIALVATDYFTAHDVEGSKDPYERMSLSVQSSLHTSLPKRISLLVEGCKGLNVDGILDRFHAGCRTTAGDALIIKDAITKELGIPALLLEWEGFDPRAYNHEQYKRRLETFKTMLIK